MEDFRDCLADCGLADLGFSGYPYTWDNRRQGNENIQVRLDRGTCNNEFMAMFPDTHVQHIITEESDHCALVAKVLEPASERDDRGPRQFRYEEAWTRHERYESMVVEKWNAADTGGLGISATCSRLSTLSKGMQEWGRVVFGSIRNQIKQLQVQLKDAKFRALRTSYQSYVR